MGKIKIPKATKSFGYVGVWKNEPQSVGWMAPSFVGPQSRLSRKYPDQPNSDLLQKHAKGERLFLCEIILNPVKDKKGRPITKIVK